MTLPPVPDPFYWTEQSLGAALKCRALDSTAAHVFTTRQLRLSSAGDWRRAGEAVGAVQVVTLTQVHGRDVVGGCGPRTPLVDSAAEGPSDVVHGAPTGDVLISDDPRVALAVRAADCVPLLLADPRTGAVGAVHAGWRGDGRRRLPDARARRRPSGPRRRDGSEHWCVLLRGRHRAGRCVRRSGTPAHLIDRWFVAPPPRRDGTGRPRLRLDLAGANRDQLILAGVRETNIHLCGLCTEMHPEVLTSFRAEQEGAGRLAGVIRRRM